VSEPSSTARARSTQPGWVNLDPNQDKKRRPPLSGPQIVRVALRLADEHGLGALTMRALAQELKVSTMALYNHVHDKEELVDLMVDLMLGEVDCSPSPGDWLAQLRTVICSYHQVLARHCGLARIYASRVRIGPHGLLVMERILRLLLEAGFSPAEAADAFFALFTYSVGYHQMGHVDPMHTATPEEKLGYYSALPANRIPTVTALARHLSGVHQSGRFEYGLDTLLAGLAATLPTTTTPAQPQSRETNSPNPPRDCKTTV
jgi:AcrR family transcriptional regulator